MDHWAFWVVLILIFLWPDDAKASRAWRAETDKKLKLIDKKLDRLLGYWDDGK